MVRWRSVCGGCLFAVALAAAALLPGCGRHRNPWDDVPGGSTKVLASFPPLYCFAKTVAGDDAKVISLLTTVGPHDHKVDATDAYLVRGADLFLINGLGLDDFVIRLANSSANPHPDLVQKSGEAIPAPKKGEVSRAGFLIHNAGEEGHKHADGQVCPICGNGDYDPHVWLGIEEAIVMVHHIRDVLQKQDAAHKEGYQKRADELVGKLRKLQADGLELLKDKKNRVFVTNHHSFRYFARSFGLTVLDSIQLQAGVAPTTAHLDQLVRLCKQHDVRVIGVEPQYSQAAAGMLKDLCPDLTIVDLDPIETAPPNFGADYYLRVMEQNLNNLVKHLQ